MTTARISALFLFAFLATASAQEPTPKKSQITFAPGSNLPSLQKSTKSDPIDAAIDNFFIALQAGQIDSAYDRLTANSVYGERADDVALLKKKTEEAIKAYGAINGYELIQEKKAGEHLVRRTYISLGDKLPLRWRFYYYKTKDGWKMVDFRVDDGLVDLLEEVQKNP